MECPQRPLGSMKVVALLVVWDAAVLLATAALVLAWLLW
jgi:hypothetical protein